MKNGGGNWRTVAGFHLHWREWGNECLVFQEGAAGTHLLGPLEAAVLRCVESAPAGEAELLAAVSAGLGVPADEELNARIDAVSAQLEVRGLIERLPA